MSISIISRLNSSFELLTDGREKPDFMTRDIGGHFRLNHPYISGYYQVMFGLPAFLFNKNENSAMVASQWLHSTVESFTPHSHTLSKVDLVGQGQIGSSFVSNVITNREFSMTFREYQNLPIMNILRRWTAVFDPFTGVSPLSGNEFIAKNYKGWCVVVLTKPVRSQQGKTIEENDIEECFVYSGVWPQSIPIDTLNQTNSGNDAIELNVSFSFDNAPLTASYDNDIKSKVAEVFNSELLVNYNTFEKYETIFNKETKQWAPNIGHVVGTGTPA